MSQINKNEYWQKCLLPNAPREEKQSQALFHKQNTRYWKIIPFKLKSRTSHLHSQLGHRKRKPAWSFPAPCYLSGEDLGKMPGSGRGLCRSSLPAGTGPCCLPLGKEENVIQPKHKGQDGISLLVWWSHILGKIFLAVSGQRVLRRLQSWSDTDIALFASPKRCARPSWQHPEKARSEAGRGADAVCRAGDMPNTAGQPLPSKHNRFGGETATTCSPGQSRNQCRAATDGRCLVWDLGVFGGLQGTARPPEPQSYCCAQLFSWCKRKSCVQGREWELGRGQTPSRGPGDHPWDGSAAWSYTHSIPWDLLPPPGLLLSPSFFTYTLAYIRRVGFFQLLI